MPKTKEQFEQIKEERKKAILDAALYLFAVEGYDAVTSDSITKKVGCSHGLLYHYFRTKEELFEYLVLNVVVRNYLEIIKDVNPNQSPKPYMKDLLDSYLNALKQPDIKYACSLYLLLNLHLQKKLFIKIQQATAQGKKKLFDIVQKKIEEGQKIGELKDFNPTKMVIALFACLKGLSYTRIHLEEGLFICPDVDIIIRMIADD